MIALGSRTRPKSGGGRTGCASKQACSVECIVLALGAGGALAQDQYPNRTVKLIVPTSPGAVTDIIARALGQALSQSWGQPFVIDNRPGGDETLGIEATAKSPPDGYTWC